MSLLYGEQSFVAIFRLQTDVITIKANQTFPALLTAFTICLWFSSTPPRYWSSEKTMFTYLPDDTTVDGVYISLLPRHVLFSVNNDFIIASAKVSSHSYSLSISKLNFPRYCCNKYCQFE